MGDQQVGREREHADEQQHQQVDAVGQRVGLPHQLRHPGVADPHPADEHEADQVAEELVPLIRERRKQATVGGRDGQLEDEQGDRDREDAVGEGVEAVERQDVRGSGPATVARRVSGVLVGRDLIASLIRLHGSMVEAHPRMPRLIPPRRSIACVLNRHTPRPPSSGPRRSGPYSVRDDPLDRRLARDSAGRSRTDLVHLVRPFGAIDRLWPCLQRGPLFNEERGAFGVGPAAVGARAMIHDAGGANGQMISLRPGRLGRITCRVGPWPYRSER